MPMVRQFLKAMAARWIRRRDRLCQRKSRRLQLFKSILCSSCMRTMSNDSKSQIWLMLLTNFLKHCNQFWKRLQAIYSRECWGMTRIMMSLWMISPKDIWRSWIHIPGLISFDPKQPLISIQLIHFLHSW